MTTLTQTTWKILGLLEPVYAMPACHACHGGACVCLLCPSLCPGRNTTCHLTCLSHWVWFWNSGGNRFLGACPNYSVLGGAGGRGSATYLGEMPCLYVPTATLYARWWW